MRFFEMNKATINAVKIIAERMIVESRTDDHTCKTEETYCAGCQKMRDAMQLLMLMQDSARV
jgi:hypothetical protein